MILYSVRSTQRILKNAKHGGGKGKYNKQDSENTKQEKRKTRVCTGCCFVIESMGFIKIGDCGGDEENGDVDPIGGLTNDTVVSVEKRWDQ